MGVSFHDSKPVHSQQNNTQKAKDERFYCCPTPISSSQSHNETLSKEQRNDGHAHLQSSYFTYKCVITLKTQSIHNKHGETRNIEEKKHKDKVCTTYKKLKLKTNKNTNDRIYTLSKYCRCP